MRNETIIKAALMAYVTGGPLAHHRKRVLDALNATGNTGTGNWIESLVASTLGGGTGTWDKAIEFVRSGATPEDDPYTADEAERMLLKAHDPRFWAGSWSRSSPWSGDNDDGQW